MVTMKRILEFAGDLRFAFWLILSAGVVMWAGSIYSTMNYTLINSLNGVPLAGWFSVQGIENLSVTWWIPVLFLIFALLGINTIACTLNRVMALLPRRKSIGLKRFLVLISPSVIHILFIFMLAGHLLSFTAVTQDRIPVTQGDKIQIRGAGSIEVKSISYEYFPDSTLLRQRIRQVYVDFNTENKDGVNFYKTAFMEPVFINGNIIILDMEKKKQEQIIKPDPAKENCNKEQKFHYAQSGSETKPQLYLLVIKDPGIFMLLPGFCIVILIMIWYFYQTALSKKNKEFTEVENEVINV